MIQVMIQVMILTIQVMIHAMIQVMILMIHAMILVMILKIHAMKPEFNPVEGGGGDTCLPLSYQIKPLAFLFEFKRGIIIIMGIFSFIY